METLLKRHNSLIELAGYRRDHWKNHHLIRKAFYRHLRKRRKVSPIGYHRSLWFLVGQNENQYKLIRNSLQKFGKLLGGYLKIYSAT